MEPVYKYFKYCLFGFSFETGVVKIRSKLILIILSIWYSLISLLFGWWGLSIKPFKNLKATINALEVSLTGGIDYSKEMNETKYYYKTNYVWNNLLRKTTERIKKDEVEFIVEIQDEYEDNYNAKYSEENIDFILLNLGKMDIHRITRNEIKDIFDAFQSFDKNKIEDN